MKKRKLNLKINDIVYHSYFGSRFIYQIKGKRNNGLYVCFLDADFIHSFQHILNFLADKNFMTEKPELKIFLCGNYWRATDDYQNYLGKNITVFPKKFQKELYEELEKITTKRNFENIIDKF